MSTIYVRSTDGNNADTGATWALAKATLAGADATPDVAGDLIAVSQVHSESTAGSVTLAYAGTLTAPTRIICGNDGAEPPTASATTAIMAVTGDNLIQVNGNVHMYGITFNCGTSSNNSSFYMSGTGGEGQYYEKCVINIGGSNSNSRIFFNSGPAGVNAPTIRWKNVDIKFANAGQFIAHAQTVFEWEGGTLLSGGAAITTLMSLMPNHPGTVQITGVDLTNAASTLSIFSGSGGKAIIRNSKLPSSWTGSVFTGVPAPGSRYEMYNCDSGATSYKYWIKDFTGENREETTLVKTGGSSDGTTATSSKIVTSVNCNESSGRFRSIELGKRNTVVGSAITVTVDTLVDNVTGLTNAEVWLIVEYLSASGNPISTIISSQRADVLTSATTNTTSSSTWTTTGMSNPNKQKISVTFTPQIAGYIHARVVAAKASTTFYFDPVLQVS
jgi:hypothetical protein